MKPDYRHLAREALKKARDELAASDDACLQIVALQLRMAMEALTYDRAMVYAEELGPENMKTWQPKKLMDRMLEIDPYADKTATFSFGVEPSYGERPKTMTRLGTEHVLDLNTLRKHYNALGSYLHTPTIAQLEQGKSHDPVRLRDHCNKIVAAIGTVLSSKVWGTSITRHGQIDCLKCGTPIRRRFIADIDRTVECWDCHATYTMTEAGKGKARFDPRQAEIPCPNPNCKTAAFIWEKDLKPDTAWSCEGCGLVLSLVLTVSMASPSDMENSTGHM